MSSSAAFPTPPQNDNSEGSLSEPKKGFEEKTHDVAGTGSSQSQGPLAVRELSLSEALFWFRKTTSELSFWGGVGNAAHYERPTISFIIRLIVG